jgi:hypothetical protein
MDPRLEIELAGLADRIRHVRLNVGLSLCWFTAAVVAALSIVIGRVTGWDMRVAAIAAAGASLVAGVFVYLVTRARARNLFAAARQIERQFPTLDHRLLAAIEQEISAPPARLGYLQQLVVREAVEHSLRYDWRDTVPASRIARARLLQAGALALMWVGLVIAWRSGPNALPGQDGGASRTTAGNYRVSIEPGNASIERGADVLVLARFAGTLPADVHVVFQPDSGAARRLPLAKSLNDPLFGGRITAVGSDLAYHVEFDGERSPDYRLTVFDYPAVVQIDAEVASPGYTGLPNRRIDDTRHMSVVEGSAITLTSQLNKPVARAWLADDKGQTLDFSLVPGNSAECRLTIKLNQTQRYTMHLIDADGRRNKVPPEITLSAVPDRPPELVLKAPGRDVRASPIEEVSLEAQAWDDFGISSYGLTTIHGAQSPQSIPLGQEVPAKEKRQVQHTIYLEDVRAQPDELLSYYFWAEDTGHDGRPRRTLSDMFFIEVRPFEEIYRQGEQPTERDMRQQQNQGGAAQQAAQLAELQKQIINATWKVIRETDAKPAERSRDAGIIRDSQKSARDQLQKLTEQAAAPGAADAIDEIERHMTSVIEQLGTAADQSSTEPLQGALSSEQAAYQGLLKLRAREHNVVRSRQMAQSGASGANRADRQLDELELDPQQNRYENRRSPATAQQQAAREDNQILNRLRELARRQEDLNKRMRDLQSALQAERDEPQRRELQRQLERLRDEQQEMLRDLDELRDRMDRPENQQRMAETRDQLEQTRQNMRQASDSLRQERLTPALNSGTRAERELEQARDQFRRRTANQFADDMRAMREDARDLAHREQQLGDRLDQMNQAPRQSLRDDERSNVIDQIGEQRKRLGNLTDEMKTVSEAAEASEPLLSKQLYDTYRDTTQRNVDRSMQLTSEMLRRGFVPEAGQAELNVRRDVERVRAGVERAARSVLGDPAEATRRALEEVEQLTRQLQQEISRFDPQGQPASDGQPQRSTDNQAQLADATPKTPSDGSDRSRGPAGSTRESPPQPPDDLSTSRESAARGSGRRSSKENAPGSQAAESGSSSAATPNSDAERRHNPPRPGQRNAATGSGSEGNVDIAGWAGPGGPITGDEFRQWSDRLRDVEEMLENSDLRAEVAEVNDRARDVRRDLKRHSKEPNWSSVRLLIAEPLVELQTKLREELARQEASDPLVPIDRDPVPRRYSGSVREYYERLGSGK